jgi:hypothetical protein
MSDYKSALDNFEKAFALMRGNNCIKYHQLGLAFDLFASHLLFNIALSHSALGHVKKANYFEDALNAVPTTGSSTSIGFTN